MNDQVKATFKRVGELLGPMKNIKRTSSECTDEKPLILIPADQSYVEILGHKITEVKGFEDFMEYLNQRVQIEKDYAALYNDRSEFIEYLKVKLEESRLMATYENGVRYPCMKELVYKDILERVESGYYE